MSTPGPEALLGKGDLSVAELRFLWDAREKETWAQSIGYYEKLAEKVNRLGDPFWVCDIADEGLENGSESLRLHQIKALAMAQSGATHAAQKSLHDLFMEGHNDPETMGMLARTHKDLARYPSSDEERKANLHHALNYYYEAFTTTSDSYTGINAATINYVVGNVDNAREIAKEVLKIIDDPASDPDSIWNRATRAEAFLVLGRLDEAYTEYEEFAGMARQKVMALASARRQALWIAESNQDISTLELEKAFGLGPVVLFTGMMADAPDRENERFPQRMHEPTREAIRKQLQEINAGVGYASVASGADILFLEVMQELGLEYHAILPFATEEFIEVSVVTGDDRSWIPRFHNVMEKAASITYASKAPFDGDPLIFDYANQLIWGLGKLKASFIDVPVQGLSVWDGQGLDRVGGTASFIRSLYGADIPVHILQPKILTENQGVHSVSTLEEIAGDSLQEMKSFDSQSDSVIGQSKSGLKIYKPGSKVVRAMFFSDIIQYSKLTDPEVHLVLKHYYQAVADMLDNLNFQPIIRNTWGDAFYFVFAKVWQAGEFALKIRDLTNNYPWIEKGFRKDLRIRIGLHAGPVVAGYDPIIKEQAYTGYHVSRAARLEPVTAENQVYVTEPFAALASIFPDCNFNCQYVGERMLAKKADLTRIYLLNPKSANADF